MTDNDIHDTDNLEILTISGYVYITRKSHDIHNKSDSRSMEKHERSEMSDAACSLHMYIDVAKVNPRRL